MYLSAEEVAALWGTPKRQVLDAIRQGRLRAVKIGRSWKIKREWLNQYDEHYSNTNGFKAFTLENVKVRSYKKKENVKPTITGIHIELESKKLQYIPPIARTDREAVD